MIFNKFSILFFLLVFSVAQASALPLDNRSHTSVLFSDTKEEEHFLEVRKSFPQYPRNFNEQAVQEEVYTEVLKELKEKESLNNKEGDKQ